LNFIGVYQKRLSWLGHVERMTEDNIVQKIKRWKPKTAIQTSNRKT
jgi:hypothetical protein